MVEQGYFDNIYFPVPEVPRRVFYLVELKFFNEKSSKWERIFGKYFEEKELEKLIDFIVICYYDLFQAMINIQIIDKREEYD